MEFNFVKYLGLVILMTVFRAMFNIEFGWGEWFFTIVGFILISYEFTNNKRMMENDRSYSWEK